MGFGCWAVETILHIVIGDILYHIYRYHYKIVF